MMIDKEIGKRIKQARISARKHRLMTQGDLAKLIHFSSSAVFYWESGRAMPNLATIKKIAEVCGVDWRWILVGDFGEGTNVPTKWIPASEPPKEDGEYIVMIKDDSSSTTLFFSDGLWFDLRTNIPLPLLCTTHGKKRTEREGHVPARNSRRRMNDGV